MKKLLSISLVLMLALGCLAGCGSSSGGSAEDSTAAAGDAGASGETFKIGAIGPATGAAAIYGSAVKYGAQVAVDEINEAGGINGYQIEYNFQDDVHDAEKSVNAYNTLKDWGMQMLLGTVTTAPCLSVADKTVQDNMFQITPSASSPDVLIGDNIFQVCFTDPNQGAKSAEYIAENKLGTKVGIIYNTQDVYSTGIRDKFLATAKEKNLEVLEDDMSFTESSKTDFTAQLGKAKAAGADLIFLPIYYQEASIILKQANDMDYHPTFFGVDGMDGILTLEGFDTSLAEGVMLLTPFAADSEDEAVQNFVSKYTALDAVQKQPEEARIPNQFAADAYDGMYAIKAAAEKAGVTPDMDASAICDAMKIAMTEINIQGITGGEDGLKWEATGEVNKDPKAVVIKDGAYQSME